MTDAFNFAMCSDHAPGVSVVICCYNSESRIEPTLRHLAAQVTGDDLPWEVVLVDNASTDNTAKVAVQLWGDLEPSIPLRIVNEKQPGLSAARRRGTLEAAYDILIFCDDDNWLAADYIRIASDFMQSSPAVGICGGIGTSVSDAPFPDWFEHAKSSYAVGEQAEEEGACASYIYGAGIVMRRAVLLKSHSLGIMSLLTDRKGNALTAGGDGEIAEWFAMLGYSTWYYLPALHFQHFIPSNRITRSYLSKLQTGFGQAAPTLRMYRLNRRSQLNWLTSLWIYQVTSWGVLLLQNLATSSANPLGRWIGVRRCWHSLQWLLANRSRYLEVVAAIKTYALAARCEEQAQISANIAGQINDQRPRTVSSG